MTTTQVRVSPEWLTLREPADADARAGALVAAVLRNLNGHRPTVIHDLGSGSGSMARWLAARLPGPQHWVLCDRDAELLTVAEEDPPGPAADGGQVTLETRQRDITRLEPGELGGAALITASALLDMMTQAELDRFVVSCAEAECPVLIALNVTGRVELSPADPFDRLVEDAFNAHQRRDAGAGRLVGPDAVEAAGDGFTRLGLDVIVSDSPWRLGARHAQLAGEWFEGWVAAACEQQPELRPEAVPYARRRLAQASDGVLAVTLHHQDLLARPR